MKKAKRWHEARKLLDSRTVCQICKRRKSELVAHKVARSQGGTDEPSNWQVVCRPCHDRKSRREQAAWLRSPAGRAACIKGGKSGAKIIADRRRAAALKRWGTSDPKERRRLWYQANRDRELAKATANRLARRTAVSTEA